MRILKKHIIISVCASSRIVDPPGPVVIDLQAEKERAFEFARQMFGTEPKEK